MKESPMKYSTTIEANGKEHDVIISFTVSKHRPATMYDRHGDPGSPAEGGELEIHYIINKRTGEELDDSYINDDIRDSLYEYWNAHHGFYDS